VEQQRRGAEQGSAQRGDDEGEERGIGHGGPGWRRRVKLRAGRGRVQNRGEGRDGTGRGRPPGPSAPRWSRRLIYTARERGCAGGAPGPALQYRKTAMPFLDTRQQRASFLILLLGVGLFVALWPFSTGLIGAPVLYVVLAPVYHLLARYLGSRTAAGLTVAT